MLTATQKLNSTLVFRLLPVDTDICDLYFILILSLCPRAHADKVTFEVLGFITRIYLENLNSPIRLRPFSIVRLIVEHSSVVQDPPTANASNKLKHVQRRFLRTIKYPFNINCPPCD